MYQDNLSSIVNLLADKADDQHRGCRVHPVRCIAVQDLACPDCISDRIKSASNKAEIKKLLQMYDESVAAQHAVIYAAAVAVNRAAAFKELLSLYKIAAIQKNALLAVIGKHKTKTFDIDMRLLLSELDRLTEQINMIRRAIKQFDI